MARILSVNSSLGVCANPLVELSNFDAIRNCSYHGGGLVIIDVVRSNVTQSIEVDVESADGKTMTQLRTRAEQIARRTLDKAEKS